MQVEVTVAVQRPEAVKAEAVQAALPHGQVTVRVVKGGLDVPDDTSAGAGSFTFVGPPNPSTGNPNTLTGTGSSPGVAAGQVVTLASGAYLHVASVTNAGSIFVGDAGNGDTTLGCYGGCHPTLSNTGLLKTIQGGGGVRHIQVNIVNAIGGTVDMAALDTREDGGCGGGGLVNNGGLTLETGVTFAEDCSFTQASTGTFATTIDATAASYGQMSGGVVSLDGKLKVTSVGVPATGTSYGVIANAARTGTFASWDLRGVNYWRQYVPTGLNLVAEGTCDTWIGGVDAKFGTALNWSFGVPPGIAVDGCITATTTSHPPANADTYGVTADSNPAVHSLTLGATNGTQTLTIPSGRAVDTAADSLIGGHGVLKLGDTASGDSRFGCAGGGCATANPTLTNGGSLQTVAGGGGTRRFQQVIINNLAAGTMDVSGSTILQGGCQPGGGANNNRGFLNSGSVTVGNTQLTAACGFVNNVAAAVSNGGLFLVDGSVFKQRGALSGGFAVILTNGSVLDDDTSAAGGTFTLTGGSGGLHGTGTSPGIPVGSNVTVASGTTVQVSPNMTNAGSLILGDSGSGDTTLCCSFFTGGPTITNSGTIRTAQGGGGIRHIQVNIANSGSMMFAADDNRQDASCGDHATWVINDGAFSIGDGSRYTLNSCPVTASHANTFTQHLGATLHTAVNADGGKFGQLVGGVVTLDGRLEVMTFGFPPVGSSWPIISGSERSGQFVDLYVAYPPYDVQVQYVPTGVNVVYARSVSCFGARPPWPCQAAMPQPQPPRSGTGWWKQPRR